MRVPGWPWLVIVSVALVTGVGVVRVAYLERNVRWELGDELSGALEVARIEIESWSREQSAVEPEIDDRTFAALGAVHRVTQSRTSLLALRGDTVIVLATASRDTASEMPRRFLLAAGPPSVRKAFSARRRIGGAGDGLAYSKVAFAAMPVRGTDWVLLREVDGYSMVERMLLPLLLDVMFIASLFLLASAWLRSQARIGAMKREQELTRVRADFLEAVSHELRTPLAQIRMFAELLRGGAMKGPDESRRALNVIEKESSRLSILVDNLLNHASSVRDKPSARNLDHVADVNRDIQYVIDAFAPLAAEKDVRLVSAAQTVSPAVIDSQKLRQVLLNYLENALKYGPRGQTVTVGSCGADGRVRVWVEDEGPGIVAAERRSIWQPFSRGMEADRSKTGGSGIGLSVVHDIVTRVGGSAWVETGARGGSRFIAEFMTAAIPHRNSPRRSAI